MIIPTADGFINFKVFPEDFNMSAGLQRSLDDCFTDVNIAVILNVINTQINATMKMGYTIIKFT